jgi:hypothetical protein
MIIHLSILLQVEHIADYRNELLLYMLKHESNESRQHVIERAQARLDRPSKRATRKDSEATAAAGTQSTTGATKRKATEEPEIEARPPVGWRTRSQAKRSGHQG